MSLFYTHGFTSTVTAGPLAQWNGPMDSDTLVADLLAHADGMLSFSSVTVDDSVTPSVLDWTSGAHSGQLALTGGCVIRITSQTSINGSYLVLQIITPAPGTWKSDQYGRPLDLNDLLAR